MMKRRIASDPGFMVDFATITDISSGSAAIGYAGL
jgi:hypothetical protein